VGNPQPKKTRLKFSKHTICLSLSLTIRPGSLNAGLPDPGELIPFKCIPVWQWNMVESTFLNKKSFESGFFFEGQFPIDYDSENMLIITMKDVSTRRFINVNFYDPIYVYWKPHVVSFNVFVLFFGGGDSGSKETPGQHVQSYLPFCWQPRWWGELNGSKRSVACWL